MTPRRTRTPSDVKWLANELAATAGELERVEEELARLRARREQLRAVHQALSATAGVLRLPTLAEAVPPVRPHPARGGRGAIVDFVRATLREAYPQAVDTLELTEQVVQHLGLSFATYQARSHFRKTTVTRTLGRLMAYGEVERLHDFSLLPNSPGVWRWKVAAPTLKELAELAAQAGRLEPVTGGEAQNEREGASLVGS